MAKRDALTYGQLENLLTELGYHLTPSAVEGHLWTYPEFDAMHYLPAEPEIKTAPSYELIIIRKVSVEKGIIEPDDFEELLEKVRQQAHQSPISLDAA
jgi:hypothetical protein